MLLPHSLTMVTQGFFGMHPARWLRLPGHTENKKTLLPQVLRLSGELKEKDTDGFPK